MSWLATIMASLVGLIDQNQLELTDPRRNNLSSHITAGVALLVINGLLVYARFRWVDVLTRQRWLYLSLMVLGVLAILATAWLGAELVYGLGVGVQ